MSPESATPHDAPWSFARNRLQLRNIHTRPHGGSGLVATVPHDAVTTGHQVPIDEHANAATLPDTDDPTGPASKFESVSPTPEVDRGRAPGCVRSVQPRTRARSSIASNGLVT